MRYEYTVTKESGEAEIMKAMSWKKLFKSLLLKYPKFSGWGTYFNNMGVLIYNRCQPMLPPYGAQKAV